MEEPPQVKGGDVQRVTGLVGITVSGTALGLPVLCLS